MAEAGYGFGGGYSSGDPKELPDQHLLAIMNAIHGGNPGGQRGTLPLAGLPPVMAPPGLQEGMKKPAEVSPGWSASRENLNRLNEQLAKEFARASAAPSKGWADLHPVLAGLLSMVPGFQQGYTMRTQLNQRAQQLDEQNRMGLLRDRIAINQMLMRGEMTPAQAKQLTLQKWFDFQRATLMAQRNALLAQKNAASEKYYKGRLGLLGRGRSVGKGVSPQDRTNDLYLKTISSAYDNYLKDPSLTLSGKTPETFDAFATINFPAIFAKLQDAGLFPKTASSPASPALEGVPQPDWLRKLDTSNSHAFLSSDGHVYFIFNDGRPPVRVN